MERRTKGRQAEREMAIKEKEERREEGESMLDNYTPPPK
jgi:hypothetical protein